jgi:hypothetical protein
MVRNFLQRVLIDHGILLQQNIKHELTNIQFIQVFSLFILPWKKGCLENQN